MQLLVAGVVAGIWYILWDLLLSNPLMGSYMAAIPSMKASPPMMWIVFGDLVAGLVLASVYARTRSVFGVGLKNGLVYGVYAGVLVNFPTWIWLTVYGDWPYASAWALTIAAIAYTAIAGAVIGLVYARLTPKAPGQGRAA